VEGVVAVRGAGAVARYLSGVRLVSPCLA